MFWQTFNLVYINLSQVSVIINSNNTLIHSLVSLTMTNETDQIVQTTMLASDSNYSTKWITEQWTICFFITVSVSEQWRDPEN